MNNTTTNTVSDTLERIIELTGRAVAWLVLVLVCLTLIVAIPRYVLSNETFLSWHLLGIDWEAVRLVYSRQVNALNDAIQYVHAIIFMVGISYALRHGDHVRIDILYRNGSPRQQARINVLGMLLLFYPTFGYIFYMSWDYVLNAWRIFEGSSRPGGLPLLYLLKTFLLIMPVLMIMQGTAILLREWHRWRHGAED